MLAVPAVGAELKQRRCFFPKVSGKVSEGDGERWSGPRS